MLEDIKGSAQPPNISITLTPFGIRLYNLPTDSRTKKRARAIGGGLEEGIEVDWDGLIAWDKFARLKILLDITKPLRRIQQVRSMDESIAIVELKYERLPNLCYACKILG